VPAAALVLGAAALGEPAGGAGVGAIATALVWVGKDWIEMIDALCINNMNR